MKVVIIVLLLAVAAAASKYGSRNARKPQIENRLHMGESAVVGQFPFAVGLRNDEDSEWCGGSIISPKHIITEGWCFDDVPSMTIIAGCVDFFGEDCEEYQFENVWIHPNATGSLAVNDLAIISIQGEFALSDAVQIIPLVQETVPDNSSAVVIGWSPALLWMDVVVEPCTSWEGPTVICTAPSVVGGGDYGCPLVVDGTLAGIPVLGGTQDIYQRISPYVDWINSVISG